MTATLEPPGPVRGNGKVMGPRYSFAPIDRLYPPASVGAASQRPDYVPITRLLGVEHNTLNRWRRNGLTTMKADKIATALGFHPAELWPSWSDDAALEPCCRWCGEPLSEGVLYCNPDHSRHSRAADKRQWRERRKLALVASA